MEMKEVLSEEEFAEAISADKVAVVDFFANWCGPCIMMKPIFEDFAEKNPDIITISINSDLNPKVCENLGIMYLPTFVVFKGGKELSRSSGYMQSQDFEKFISDAIKD